MPGREEHENSEKMYYDGILPANKADRAIQQAEAGQVLPKGTIYRGKADDKLLMSVEELEHIREKMDD